MKTLFNNYVGHEIVMHFTLQLDSAAAAVVAGLQSAVLDGTKRRSFVNTLKQLSCPI